MKATRAFTVAARATKLASEPNERPRHLSQPCRDVQTKGSAANPLSEPQSPNLLRPSLHAASINKNGNLHRIGTEVRAEGKGQTVGPIERTSTSRREIEVRKTCAIAIHPAAPGRHPRHNGFHPKIQRYISFPFNEQRARGPPSIVPHTLLLGQSGTKKREIQQVLSSIN